MFISDIIVNAIYINIPFCLRKCRFCHYVNNLKYSYSKVEDSYFIILLKQLEYVLKNIKNNKLSSIYFGGGTPSLLNEHQINQIKELFDNYNISSEEVSIEIYPDICNFDYDNNNFFNRFSIGVQSFDDKLLKLYNRKNYDYKIIEDIIYKIKKNNNNNKINIDLIFDEYILEDDITKALKLSPDSIVFYPNTKNRGLKRLINIYDSLNKLSFSVKNYKPLGKSKFIYLKENTEESNYSKVEYRYIGNIIGIGHNSVSYINNESYLSIFDGENFYFNKRDRIPRYHNTIISSSFTGVLKNTINKYFKSLLDCNLFIEDENNNEVIYIPEYNYIYFYKYLLENYNNKYAEVFISSVSFGDSDYHNIEYIVNNYIDDETQNNLKDFSKANNICNNNKTFIRKKAPNKFILIEGIDGSGKDTFANFLQSEIKKRFKYTKDAPVSIIGQPYSNFKYGKESKSFIEDLNKKYTKHQVIEYLTENRKESEKYINNLGGIVICIRGILTDIATFNYAFNENTDNQFGLCSSLKRIDELIIIDVDENEADIRIKNRNIPRTWREHLPQLKYFREFYINHNLDCINNKTIIKNDDFEYLQKMAKIISNKLYFEDSFNG